MDYSVSDGKILSELLGIGVDLNHLGVVGEYFREGKSQGQKENRTLSLCKLYPLALWYDCVNVTACLCSLHSQGCCRQQAIPA